MYDAIQTALTATIEAIAFISVIGLPAHYIFMSHINKVKSCGTLQATPEPEFKPEVVTESPQPESENTLQKLFQQAEQIISKPVYTEVEPEESTIPKEIVSVAVEKPIKPRKARTSKLQPMSVGAAVIDYNAMTSEQLRKECALQGVAWRNGGDYGKPMKKVQMLAALR